MASVHKLGNSPFWAASYRKADGKRTFRSTKTTSKRQAQKVALAWERAAWEARHGRLSPDRAREIVGHGIAEIMRAGGEEMPSFTIAAWLERWMESKTVETEASTVERYQAVVDRFLATLGRAKASRNLETLRAPDLMVMRDRLARDLSKATANMFSKVIKSALGAAVRQGVLTSNPAAALGKLKGASETKRRPFTLKEIQNLLDEAKETEWRGMILCGLYLGARLGDVSSLQWGDIDLPKRTIAFTAEKTGRRMLIPLAPPLADYFESLPSSDDPATFIFPKCAALGEKASGTLSNQFHKLMADVGLVTKRKHTNRKHAEAEKGEGRKRKREPSPVSFHSLRHSFVTMLKKAGATDAMARELAGHESEAVSRLYTHFDADTLRGAVDSLPDVTRKEAEK